MSLQELLVLLVPIGLGLLLLALLFGALFYLFRFSRRVLRQSSQGMNAMDEALELSRRSAANQEESNRLLAAILEELRAGRGHAGP